MAEWRFLRGWTEAELEARAAALDGVITNYTPPEAPLSIEQGWSRYYSEAELGSEPPGDPQPDGPFQRARVGIESYAFSDPAIVTAHFDPAGPLLGRRMLLEIRVLGLRYLNGVVVGAVRDDSDDEHTTFGFRYDTLQGHIERGAEWFLLRKSRRTGEIRYTIEAFWRPGDFPNWWSRVGFEFLSPIYQRRWHHRAQHRLHRLAAWGSLAPPVPADGRLVHEGPVVIFEAHRVRQRRAILQHQLPDAGPGLARALGTAAVLGGAAGLRTTPPVFLLGRRLANGAVAGGTVAPATPLQRAWHGAARVMPIAVAGEIIADKTPVVPDRIRSLPLAGRAASGALCGGTASARLGRSRVLGTIVGAAAAIATAHGAFRLRRRLARRFPDLAIALLEDVVAFGASALAARAAAPRTRPLRDDGR